MASNLRVLFPKGRIFLLCEDPDLVSVFRGLWPAEDMDWEIFESGLALLEKLFVDPPHMVITSSTSRDMSAEELVAVIKNENVYRQVRTVMLLDAEAVNAGIDWQKLKADDYLLLPPSTPAALRTRLELVFFRSTNSLDANPLTRLPGNVSIIQTLEQYAREGRDFAMAYADIDHFKSFNDRYGFARGDEALLMTARVISATVKNIDATPNFVGHVGGDDFVFILPSEVISTACEEIISAYDTIVPSFYDERDRLNGYIDSIDRHGNIERFPLLSISIAVVFNEGRHPKPFSELSHIAGQVKHQAKSRQGSSYVLDRRNTSDK